MAKEPAAEEVYTHSITHLYRCIVAQMRRCTGWGWEQVFVKQEHTAIGIENYTESTFMEINAIQLHMMNFYAMNSVRCGVVCSV